MVKVVAPAKVVPPVLETVSVLLLAVKSPLNIRAEVPFMVLFPAVERALAKVLDPPDACRVPPFKVNNPAPRAVLVPAAIVPAVNVVPP